MEAIVLAAGLATRMGEIKPLIAIDGEPALARVLGRIRAAGIRRSIVVLGSKSARAVADAVDLSSCTVVENDRPEVGMSRSLRLGLEAVSAKALGVLVFHADMPFVRTDTIRGVLRSAEKGASIAAPVHAGRRGFPVFFRRSHFPGLREGLSGDEGGRAYIEAHRTELTTVDTDDPGCVYDVDRPAELAAWEGDRVCATNA